MPNRSQKDAREVIGVSQQAFKAGGVKGSGALEGPPLLTTDATVVRADPAHTNTEIAGGGFGAQGGPLADDIPAGQLPRPPEKEWFDGTAGEALIGVSNDDIAKRDKDIIAQNTLPRPPEIAERRAVKTAWTDDEIEEAVSAARELLNPADLEGLRLVREYASLLAERARLTPKT